MNRQPGQRPRENWAFFFTVSGLLAIVLSLAVMLGKHPATVGQRQESASKPIEAVEKTASAPVNIVTQPFRVTFPPLPDFSAYRDVSKRKKAFIDYLAPIIQYQNEKILFDRNRLYQVARVILSGDPLPKNELQWLRMMADTYDVEWREDSPGLVAVYLARRVDIIPLSLAIVQAAKESSWGRPRYAVEANNLFGQWCYEEGCGVVPDDREPGARHEVRRYDSVSDAARSYIHNLNTHPSYKELREIRQRLRMLNMPITGRALAEGLLYYSERRQTYVEEVKSMIRQFRRFQERRTG